MASRICNKTLVLLTSLMLLLISCPTIASTTERVSVSSAGVQGNEWSGRSMPSISADGRYVAFAAYASNLVSGDTGPFDIFVRDRVAGTTELISVSSSGEHGNRDCLGPSISADGRYVTFASSSTNLVPGDTNGVFDIFVRDRIAGTTERVSVSSSGTQQNGGTGYGPKISADGRYVAFTSLASNLVDGDTNGTFDVFVHDRTNDTTERVSVSSDGIQGDHDGDAHNISISADGRYIAFASGSSGLVAGDINGKGDIFIHDLETGETVLASMSSDGELGNGDCAYPSLSQDGKYVAFYSYASNLVVGDSNGKVDIFERNMQNGITTRVSVSSAGMQSNDDSFCTSISTDGRYVGFCSFANNLVSGDTNSKLDVFIRDVMTDTTERISVSSTGEQGNGHSGEYSLSLNADGRCVAFMSEASNLVAGDTNGVTDVFVADLYKHQPDLLIKSATESSYTGTDVINEDGTDQTKSQNASPGQKIVYTFRVKNAGDKNDSFNITAPAGGSGWSIRYYDLTTGAELTSKVTGGGWSSGMLAPEASKGIFVKIIPDATVPAGSANTLLITAASESDSSKTDTVKTVTSFVGSYKADMIIKAGSDTSYIGTGIFNADGNNQTRSQSVSAGQKATYTFRVQNAGNAKDTFRIIGTAGGSGWSVKYYDTTTNTEITSQVTGAGWVTGIIAPKASAGVYANIRFNSTVSLGSTITLFITGRSESDTTETDTVKAVTASTTSNKPDLLIKSGGDASYSGIGIFNTDGNNQTKSQNVVIGQKVTYAFRVMNAGTLVDSFKITGPAGGSGWSVKYYDLSTNLEVTSLVTGSGWASSALAPGGSAGIYANVRHDSTVSAGSTKTLLITATSVGDSSKKDVVLAVTIAQ